MAGFGQVDLAQSFQQTAGNVSGAGIYMNPNYGVPEMLTISLWTALPNAGGVRLASGAGLASPGSWFDVTWNCVNVTPGATYYLVFSSTVSMGYDGDVTGQYPHGHVYANQGFDPFPSFDFTFRTSNCCGAGGVTLAKAGTCPGPMRLDAANCTPLGPVVLFHGPAGTYTRQGQPCNGLMLGIGSPTLAAVLHADAAGNASLPFMAPASACGRTVQAVDVASCAPSNALIL